MRRSLCTACVALGVYGVAWADDPTEARKWGEVVQPSEPEPESGFSYLGFFQSRSTFSNVGTTNPLLDGQLVGRLGGDNSTEPLEGPAGWVSELRLNSFFTYRPPILDDRVALTAGFELDFAFGDSAYGNTGNRGGGFAADQVNLQMRRLHVDVRALAKPRHTLDVRVGQQFLADGVRDPTTSRPDDLFRTGGGLRLWGSEAAGAAAFGTVRDASGVRLRYRVGGFTLWEQGANVPDDVALFVADAEWLPSWDTRLGLHLYYLNDDSGGSGGGFYGVGPQSGLTGLQGAARVDLRPNNEGVADPLKTDLVYVGLDGGLNHDLSKGLFGANAAFYLNAGRMSAQRNLGDEDDSNDTVDRFPVLGWMATGELRARWARGSGSVVRLEGTFSGADNPDTPGLESMVTGNSYGIVGAVYASHGTYLLHQDVNAINRQFALVYDTSNSGRGLATGQLGMAYDVVPDRFNVHATVAHARDLRDLASMGTEVNLKLTYEPFLFFNLSLIGAVAADTVFDRDPWAAYAYAQWVVF